jgi:mono/diheme cytochrome c family protein
VTEIPEHLLKRSKAAKAKADGEPAPADAPAASAPATTGGAAAKPAPAKAAAPAAPAGPPPPKPDIPVVAAAKARHKVPFWAMMTLSILPLWVFMYARGLTPKEPKVSGPLGTGAEVYTANCSSCHGAGGGGGVGYAFTGGEVLKTFPHIEDQLRWVDRGTQAYQTAGVDVYGNPEREGAVHNTGAKGVMPGFGSESGGALTQAEILAVVCHERYTLGGADPTGDYLDEYEKWCAPEAPAWTGLEDGSLTFANIADELEGTFVVGTEPAAGHTADETP